MRIKTKNNVPIDIGPKIETEIIKVKRLESKVEINIARRGEIFIY